MSCKNCYYSKNEDAKKGRICPNPKLTFDKCDKFRDKEEEDTLKVCLKPLSEIKGKKSKKVYVPIPPKKTIIKGIDNITMSFEYKCKCGELKTLNVPYIGKQEVTHICICRRSIIYALLIKNNPDKEEGGFIAKLTFKKSKRFPEKTN